MSESASAGPGGEHPPLFFVHIQKTAGGTLRHFIRSHLPRGALYPEGGFDPDPLPSYWELDYMRSITGERRAAIRAYVGHFPYIACRLVGPEVTTLTVLRDPIERTVSYLKMRSRDPERSGLSLEEIYDHPFDFPCFIHNHQAKVFAMTLDDKLESFMDRIEMTPQRLETAKEHLASVDLLGLQERSDEILDLVARRYGWTVDVVADQHVSTGDWEIPAGLLERIAEDNAADIEFYEYGRRLYDDRMQQ
jgi:hypothetical protein